MGQPCEFQVPEPEGARGVGVDHARIFLEKMTPGLTKEQKAFGCSIVLSDLSHA
jgi:hypothetical protein